MAFQSGDIKISGTFDDVSFYHSVFGWLVRTKGGPGRRQFKTSPAFARARENSEEFTACSRAASLIRHKVIVYTGTKEKTLYHRLIKLMRLLANSDHLSPRGKRDPMKGMLTEEGQNRLKDFEISKTFSLYDLLCETGLLQYPSNIQEMQLTSATITAPPLIKRRQKKGLYVFNPISAKRTPLSISGRTDGNWFSVTARSVCSCKKNQDEKPP